MIQLEHISKRYVGPSGTVDALKDVSVHVEKGDIYGIIGSSGAGKSTLLRMVNQLEKPDTGTVTVAGRELSRLSKAELRKMRRKIGMVFQQFNLFPHLSVLENIMLAPVDRKKLTKAEAKQTAERLLATVGLAEKAGEYPPNLSGGQQQRVAIARALITKPAIVLADEPTGNLDSKTSAEVLGLIKRTSAEFRQTVVMITHNDDIARLADWIVRIEDGKIVE